MHTGYTIWDAGYRTQDGSKNFFESILLCSIYPQLCWGLFSFMASLREAIRKKRLFSSSKSDLDPSPTMGCHPMLTENAIVGTNALRGDLSTANVRP